MPPFLTKNRRKEILDEIHRIILAGSNIGTADNARAFVERYATITKKRTRVTERCRCLDRNGRLPAALEGNANANKRLAIKAAMMTSWAVADDIEYKEQMNEWLADKPLAEIEQVVVSLWENRLDRLPNERQLRDNLTEKINLLKNQPMDFLTKYPLGVKLNVGHVAPNLTAFTPNPNPPGDKRTVHFVIGAPSVNFPYPYALEENNAHPLPADSKRSYCLPWSTKTILQLSMTAPGAVPDDPEIFVTSNLKGCSVFIAGPANSPTVYHAGIDGALSSIDDADLPAPVRGMQNGPAGDFWEALFRNLRGANEDGAVHRDMYSRTARCTSIQNRMTKAVNRRGKPGQAIDDFGCVVGIRAGGNWTFYLQQSVWLQYTPSSSRNQINVMLPIYLQEVYPNAGLIWDGTYQMLPDAVDDPNLYW